MEYKQNDLRIATIKFLQQKIKRKNDVIKKAHRHVKRLERKISKMKRAEKAVERIGNLEVGAAVLVLFTVIINKMRKLYEQYIK